MAALRVGDMKLLYPSGRLYNITRDIAVDQLKHTNIFLNFCQEENNLSKILPETLRKMKLKMQPFVNQKKLSKYPSSVERALPKYFNNTWAYGWC